MGNAYTTPHRLSLTLPLCAAFTLACGSIDEGETNQPSTPPPTDSTAETDPNLIGGLLWPGTGWKSSSADSLGLDQTGLDRARDYAFAPGRNTQALLVVYQGQLVGEWYAQGFSKDSMATSWSVAKSFLSVLYGIAMDQGDLATLDEPVGQWIPEWADDAERRDHSPAATANAVWARLFHRRYVFSRGSTSLFARPTTRYISDLGICQRGFHDSGISLGSNHRNRF